METNNTNQNNGNENKKPMENPEMLALHLQLTEYILKKVPEELVLDHFMVTNTNMQIRMSFIEEQMNKIQALVDTMCALFAKIVGTTGEGSSAVAPDNPPKEPNPQNSTQAEQPVNKVQVATPAEALNNMLAIRQKSNLPTPSPSFSNRSTVQKR